MPLTLTISHDIMEGQGLENPSIKTPRTIILMLKHSFHLFIYQQIQDPRTKRERWTIKILNHLGVQDVGFSSMGSYSDRKFSFHCHNPDRRCNPCRCSYRGPTFEASNTQLKDDKVSTSEANNAMTLSDFMSWQMDQENQAKKDDTIDLEKVSKTDDSKFMRKPLNIMVNKKFISIFKLETQEA
ncbi:hypothetical protein ZIOFF_057411 [Zingiber officinale]|uniref:Uncharacterized protein n=1 Tax=Zingiber officinale TaxID=94328 RepID=A0A8J5F6Z2_ZINOF|nr:hypothetical protein ZIOFF_057411 [Zingiber officinale]